MAAKTIALIIAIVIIFGIIIVSIQPQTDEFGNEYIVDPKTGDEFHSEEYTDPQSLEEDLILEPPGFEKATTSDDCETQDDFFRDICYSNLALIKSDFSYCNSIGEENMEIIDNCFYDLALQEKSNQLCKKMNFGITDCLTELALLTLDPKHCEEAGFEKSTCLAAVNENSFSLCENLGFNRRHCVYVCMCVYVCECVCV